MISGMETRKHKCTYCKQPAGDDFKYSYGMPGLKHVFKCDRWWCTTYQKFKAWWNSTLPVEVFNAVIIAIRTRG